MSHPTAGDFRTTSHAVIHPTGTRAPSAVEATTETATAIETVVCTDSCCTMNPNAKPRTKERSIVAARIPALIPRRVHEALRTVRTPPTPMSRPRILNPAASPDTATGLTEPGFARLICVTIGAMTAGTRTTTKPARNRASPRAPGLSREESPG